MRTKNLCVLIVIFILACRLSAADNGNRDILFISDAVKTALSTHPDVSAAGSRMNIYGERLHRANAAFLPEFDIGVKYDRLSYLSQQKEKFLDTPDDFQAIATAKLSLFSGFKNLSERNAALLNYEASKQDLKSAKATVAYEARRLYYNALFYRNVLKNKEELLKRAEVFYADSKALNKRSNIPRTEQLLRIRVLVNTFRTDVIGAERKYQTALKNLCYFIWRTGE